MPFLQKKYHYYLTLAVIATTLFSWFNLNSYLIILLVLCRLLDGGPRTTLKTAFGNKYFLAYFSLFLLEFIGLFYTHHFFTGWKHVESKATLVAIPFILCAGPFAGPAVYRRLRSDYCLLLAIVCGYCLVMSCIEFHWQRDTSVFFYHSLTSSISVNAVFFSAYMIIAILFLLYLPDAPVASRSSAIARSRSGRFDCMVTGRWRVGLLIFFTGMMVLLSSRLLVLLLVLIFIGWLAGQIRQKRKAGMIAGIGLLIIMGAGLLAFTDNSFSRRWRDLHPALLVQRVSAPEDTPSDFDGLSLRMRMWRYAFEILHEHKAWLFGVSAGDSQELLDQKYLDAGMSQGYLRYNFHNEYIEVLVRSGFFGEIVFMTVVVLLIGAARSAATPTAGFTVAMVLLLFMTESALEMQHILFLFAFFPVLIFTASPPPPSSDR
jgi:O-antigen ligase